MENILFHIDVPLQHALIVFKMFSGMNLVGPSVMLRRGFLTCVGGYEQGRRVADDLELHLRLLWEANIRFANLPDSLFLYRRHEHSKSLIEAAKGGVVPLEVRRRALERLWPEAPYESGVRLYRLSKLIKLNWMERNATKPGLETSDQRYDCAQLGRAGR